MKDFTEELIQTLDSRQQELADLSREIWEYAELSEEEHRSSRRLAAYLKENGIYSAFHYVPLHSSPAGRKFGRFSGEDVYTTRESERLLRLPMFYNLPMEDVAYIVEKILCFDF